MGRKYGHLSKLALVSEAVSEDDVVEEESAGESTEDEQTGDEQTGESTEDDGQGDDEEYTEEPVDDFDTSVPETEDDAEEPTEKITRKRMELIGDKLNELLDTYSELYEVLISADINGDDRVLLADPMDKLKTSIELLDKYISDNKDDTFAIKTRNLLLFRTTLSLSKNRIDQIIYDNTIHV